MASYQLTFNPTSDSELYGIYIWTQHVVGSLYPLTQNIEISLRNAIDNEARRRFGDKWWTLPQFNTPGTTDFRGNFTKAERTLTRNWLAIERKRLALPAGAAVPTPIPTWSHDSIVAATDFSTWEYVLKDDFSAPNRASEATHLWPASMGKVFRHYNLLNSSSVAARRQILDLVRELREYRNRLFHHDKIWVGAIGTNARTAIDSIRRKVNKMELLVSVIDSRLLTILEKVGVLPCARRVCSTNDLDIYRYAHVEPVFTARKKRVLRTITSYVKKDNITAAWTYGGSVYGCYRIR